MSALTIEEMPTLTDPVLIVAFAGWNDAGGSATHAAQFLVQRLQARRFANLDPEEFYDFSELRPQVRLRDGVYREVTWPANDFFYSRAASPQRNLIFGVGIEPHLRWKTYATTILDLVKQCGANLVITLGALLADVPYSRPVRVAGFSSDPALAAQLQFTPSRYEGPTGIVGVLNDTCRRAGLASISFWANVPHYISAAPNPKAALALVNRLESFLHFTLDTTELQAASIDFEKKVAHAVAENPNMAAYVRQLEEREREEDLEMETAPKGNGGNGHANGKDLEEDLQRFLRHRKDKKDDE
ncbi:MAG TPA: PAC2 family protein [Candidatus Binatia bacterium]|jgi:proteasome assembly chaperone (PAC2) family protein|nr:PAC2 family protein [Candidatus Binatia bacterium]